MINDFVKVDKSRFNDAIKAYFLWKELNGIIKNSHSRGVNFPETISETLCCAATGFVLNKAFGGDAYDTENNKIIEIKASSNWDKDTTSFSPSEKFDKLYFLRLDQREDELYIYDVGIDSTDLKSMKVNKNETLQQQQEQGRRPRFSIIKNLIEVNNILPILKINLRTKKIIQL
jgi:type-2 restriction enzyme bsp6I